MLQADRSASCLDEWAWAEKGLKPRTCWLPVRNATTHTVYEGAPMGDLLSAGLGSRPSPPVLVETRPRRRGGEYRRLDWSMHRQ